MSLIEEALRRLNDPLVKVPDTAPAPAKKRPDEQRAAAHSWPVDTSATPRLSAKPLQLVALSIAILTTALVIGGAFWLGRALPEMPGSASQPTPAPALSPAAAQDPVPAPRLQEPEPKLTGIVVGGGAPYAVIDGAVAGVGDRVGAFTLHEIVEGAVTLRRDDGEELVLRTKR
jgi:hypothetical protein